MRCVKNRNCAHCDRWVEQAVKRVPFRYKKETAYIDNVPLRGCGRCGETYYEAEVDGKLERIAASRNQIWSTVSKETVWPTRPKSD